MYSGPNCFSSLLCNVAISWAVYSEICGSGLTKGLIVLALSRCWSPGLFSVSIATSSRAVCHSRRHCGLSSSGQWSGEHCMCCVVGEVAINVAVAWSVDAVGSRVQKSRLLGFALSLWRCKRFQPHSHLPHQAQHLCWPHATLNNPSKVLRLLQLSDYTS